MHDLILLGGGLANGLIAWRLKTQRPELRILLVEQGATLGGNHTWSFYRPDLTPAQLAWMTPMIVRQWPGYEVRFPAHRRTLDTPCYSIGAERFHAVLSAALGNAVMLHATADVIDRHSVRIDGRTWQARAIIDGRGPAPSPHLRHAWQKFIGQEVVLERPHGQTLPVIMDATVAQHDGYRFVYTLPFDERRILIEDTYYGTSPALDAEALRRNIREYAARRGWRIAGVVREESGVLPIALSGDIGAFWNDKREGPACSGLRAALFHATTGYSLPHAVRLAESIARLEAFDAETLQRHVRDFSVREWRGQLFMRLLNRMLFFASPPSQRYRLLQRFYRLPQDGIERFYAGRLTRLDQARILTGRPPVPVLAAVKAIWKTGKEPSSKPS